MSSMMPATLTRRAPSPGGVDANKHVRGQGLSAMPVLAFVICGALLMSACSTGEKAQTRFYVLDAMPADVVALDGAQRDPPLAIDIAALRLPQYLERPQIVTRSADNQLSLAEYDQWGGNLAKNMMRVTARNLTQLLDTAQITIFSRRPPKTPDLRVEIDVLQFERGPDGRVFLSAQWRILSAGDGEPKVARISDLYSAPLASDAALDKTVRAMSELTAELSREIAIAIIASTP